MNYEGIIATPFGYLLDILNQLTSNYGLALIIFAILVQMVMLPVGILNRKNKEKKARLQPQVDKIRQEYENDFDKQTDLIAELYKKEKVSLAGNFILSLIPYFILIPIFQVVAQPITYVFHEKPETSSKIVAVMKEEAPELFVSSYNQFTAIANIADYTDVIQNELGEEVSSRTLEGLDCSFLGLDLTTVAGTYILGQSDWAWDWAHIGAVLFPIVYLGRRIYYLVAYIVRLYSRYAKDKKKAIDAGIAPPRLPNPPVLQMFFLFLSLTAMSAIPIAMNLYWIVGGLAGTGLHKLAMKMEELP